MPTPTPEQHSRTIQRLHRLHELAANAEVNVNSLDGYDDDYADLLDDMLDLVQELLEAYNVL